MNWSMFNLQTLMLGVFGVIIYLAFRYLSKRAKGQSGIIIYVCGNICLAISIYSVGIMLIDICVSDYFSIVDNYKDVSMWVMLVITLGASFFIAMIDPIARDLRKNTGKVLTDIKVKDLENKEKIK